ncbi:hypothetical protein EVC20_011 [Rhizobium phage RHph_Y2_17_1]|nr:hypothetical protein EVC19_011 [Rhizobium phage RHph_Y2_11]QIG75750.1 hypothetical protein EVC20_011 [Rhizobium phage RHph_Y2_17_1]
MSVTQVHFNTGRLYTAAGQIIFAKLDTEANLIHVADYSRAVSFTTDGPILGRFVTERCMAEFVMRKYDQGKHQQTAESWALLMMRDNRPSDEPTKIQL